VSQDQQNMMVEFEFSVGESEFKILRKRSVKGKRGSGVLEFFRKQ